MFSQSTVQIDAPYILLLFAGAGSVIGTLFWMLKGAWDRELARVEKDKELMRQELERMRKIDELQAQLSDEEGRKKAWKEMAAEAIKAAVDTTNVYRAEKSKPPLPVVPPVISNTNSPSTARDREIADLETAKAKLAAVKRAEGLPPKPEPPREEDVGKPEAEIKVINVDADIVNIKSKEPE